VSTDQSGWKALPETERLMLERLHEEACDAERKASIAYDHFQAATSAYSAARAAHYALRDAVDRVASIAWARHHRPAVKDEGTP